MHDKDLSDLVGFGRASLGMSKAVSLHRIMYFIPSLSKANS